MMVSWLVNESGVKPAGCYAQNKLQLHGTINWDSKLQLNKNGFSLDLKVCRDGAEVT